MYPHGPRMNRSTHSVQPGLPPNSAQGVPGMPSMAMMSAPSAAGFAMHHSMGPVPSGPLNMQTNQNKMWQQPQQQQDLHSQQLLQQPQQQKDRKHHDYLKQQQRLKAMPLSSSKAISADTLIGNLLEKKDTFTIKQGKTSKQVVDQAEFLGHPSQVRQPVLTSNGSASGLSGPQDNLPGWLNPNSVRLPSIYSHIWSLVIDPLSGGMFVDTSKIIALLSTSGLPKEVLGFIWNLATSGASDKLNQQQLYVTLALVALAQMGCTFNNLSVLNFIPTPPIPTFNMNVPKSGTDDKPRRSDLNATPSLPLVSSTTASSTPLEAPLTSLTSSFQSVAPTIQPPCPTESDDFADDFSDFQSADLSHSLPSSSLCTSLPSTAVIQPSMTAKQVVNELNHSVVNKLGRNHGRSIGSRLANYSLGAPKTNANQKPRRASEEYDNSYIQDDLATSFERTNSHLQGQKGRPKYVENSETEDFCDFQVAAGLNVNVDELFPKCHPKSRNEELVLRESSIRNKSEDDETGKNKEEELFGVGVPALPMPPTIEPKVPTTQIGIPLVPPPPSKPTKELMSIEEDKYSALRFIGMDNTKSATSEISGNVSNSQDTDDFGDFVSADDLFAEIAVRDKGTSMKQVNPPLQNPTQVPSFNSVEFPIDDWGLQKSQASQGSDCLSTVQPNGTSNKFDNLTIAFSDLDITKENSESLMKEESSTKWSFDLDIGKESTSLNINSGDTTSLMEDDFGDFVGPDVRQLDDSVSKVSSVFLSDQLWADNESNKLAPNVLPDNKSICSLELPGVTLSRHGSLPSLDLNLFPANEDISDKVINSQVADWIRCLEGSLSLLQAAANTFTKISSHSVVMEVLATAEGRNYLTNLLEVHRVAWRIQRSYRHSGHESNQIDTTVGSIERVWSTLQNFYRLANIESAVENDGSDEESGQPACGVCGSPASRSVLEYGGHVYHAPCANLWLNCVDRTLPAHSPLL